ncbi:MAG: family 20 glycosylhydrolase, partial [Saprospiraceae bacterium]
TLRQLFPPAFSSPVPLSTTTTWSAPASLIEDAPRFPYRGLHLDVARHFFPVAFVKKYIDLLAMHKLNTFHWHLTDDQGWRIEIKKYPELQSMAACRKETLVGHAADLPQVYDGQRYCGYYTQEEIKDVIEYARRRFVTIIPEIEMPGHAQAALAAYPELGCTGGPYETATEWGVFGDVFCAGNEQTFAFLDEVLTEVCALFPGPYVHIGGDECPKDSWKACPKCQKRMKDNHLPDEHALQSYFIARAEKMVEKHGKKIIGWDEILEGGLAPNATVMSWRGTEGGIAAARQHHNVVMTPGSYLYLDHYQSDPATEPLAIGGYLPLEKVYSYEPVPDSLTTEEAHYILGAQGNVWTEYLPTTAQVEYMAYPRVCALAEVVWTAKAQKNWPDFVQRIKTHFARLDALGVGYAKSFYDVSASFSGGKVTLKTLNPEVKIRFTTNGQAPTASSSDYSAPFPITKNTLVQAAAFSHGKALGKTLTVSYLVHKASGKTYTLSPTPDQYNGGETYALTNGVVGNPKAYGSWVGLVNQDIDPIIDLGVPTKFSRVTLHYLDAQGSWIYPPRGVVVYGSTDGQNFTSLASHVIEAQVKPGSHVETVVLVTPDANLRYLKVVVQKFGVIPDGAPGAGEGAWVFVDEIIVD